MIYQFPAQANGCWIIFTSSNRPSAKLKKTCQPVFSTSYQNWTGRRCKDHPRIFALAWEWIGYSQSQIDLTQAAAFVQDYQQVTPLTIGELWALPIMLRIGILERLVYAAAELTGMDAPKSLSEIPSQFASPALANETIVANCFLSLRLLSATDWKDFFEQTSRVEQILRDDPARIYAGHGF